MTCMLFLVRHGIAVDAGPGVADADRGLTEVGARKVTRIALGLRRLGVRPEAILSSPLLRAQQTSEGLQRILLPGQDVEIYAPLAPGHDPSEIIRGLHPRRGARQLILVGHQPDLGLLVSYLLTGSNTHLGFDFKKGGVAAVELPTLSSRSIGSLRWFMTPRQLRALAKK